jgi:uncharacterized protein DUF6401
MHNTYEEHIACPLLDHERAFQTMISVACSVMTWLRALQEAGARRELAVLRDRIMPGFRSFEPGLHAAIDQHAAAIRDILGLSVGRAGPVELAAYARGVRDAAADQGWRTESTSAADWVTIRLLAAVSLSSKPCHDALALPTL